VAKREKIILIITVIVAIYGALDFLVFSKKSVDAGAAVQNKSAQLSAEASQLAIQTKIKNNKIQQLVKQINTPWPGEAFFSGPVASLQGQQQINSQEAEVSANFRPGMFVYSGFLKMGDDTMAIINGSDYKKGDNINGFTLTTIGPKQIKLVMKGVPFEIKIKPPNTLY